MNNDYNKILRLIRLGYKYIYKEKYESWRSYVINSVLVDNKEVEVVLYCLELLERNISSSIVLDEIYSTRLDINHINNIIFSILQYSKYGPKFMKDIYKDYMVKDISNMINKVEEENKRYIK